jgi:hypothetical protein
MSDLRSCLIDGATYLVALDETPSVDIDDHTPVSTFTSQQVKAAYSLAKRIDNVASVFDLLGGELANESSLFAIGIAPNKTVDYGGFTGLGVRKVGSDGVDLDILGLM